MGIRNIRNLRLAVAVTSAQILGPNAHRKALWLGPNVTVGISYGFGEAAVLGAGFSTGASFSDGLWVTEDMVGDAIKSAVFAIASGADFAAVVEVGEA